MDALIDVAGRVSLGILVFGGLFVVLAFFVIRAKIRRFAKTLREGLGGILAAQQPPRITLRPSVSPDWEDPEAVDECCAALRGDGFSETGRYRIPEMGDLHVVAFTHPSENYVAIVYDHAEVGVFADVVALFEGGESLTVGNAPTGGELDQRDGHPKIIDSELSPGEMVERLRRESRGRTPRAIPAEQLPGEFERAYAEEMDWRLARGGATEEEIRRVADGIHDDFDEEQIGAARACANMQAAVAMSTACLDTFMEQTLMSVAEWEKIRESVVVVHDQLDTTMVIGEFRTNVELPDPLDESLDSFDPGQRTARQIFMHLNAMLPPVLRYTLIGQVSEPAEADVYAGT